MADGTPTQTGSLRAEVAGLFGEMAARVQADMAYYDRLARLYRRAASALMGVAFAGLAVGTLAPLIHAMGVRLWGGGDLLAAGYVALAVGGLALVLDRTLLATRNWRRFSVAKLALEALNIRIWLEWSRYELAAHAAAGIEIRPDAVLEQLRAFEAARAEIIEDETQDWSEELKSARAEIERLIDSRKGAPARAGGQLETVPGLGATTAQPGAVRLKLPPGEASAAHLVVAVGDVTRELDEKPAQIVFGGLSPGAHALRVRGHVDGHAVEYEDVVVVTSGHTEPVELPAWAGSDKGAATPPRP